MTRPAQPTLQDLQQGRVTPEQFLASRNHYMTSPVRTRTITVKVR